MLIAEPSARTRLGNQPIKNIHLPLAHPRGGSANTQGEANSHFRTRLEDILQCVLIKGICTAVPAALVSLVLNVFVAQAMVVHGPSMQPNLSYNQRVIVDKITYDFIHSPRRGDVVIFHMPEEQELLVKRAVALPGETVEVRDGQVFINDQALEEPWATCQGGMDYPPKRVPPRHIFVLGDNRAVSRDSRFFGPVPMERIAGQVRLIIWPPHRIGLLEEDL